MKAKISKITTNKNDFQNPQMDIEIEYIDKDFPADHQYPNGGKRKFIFTMPPETYESLSQAELERKIIDQGKEFNKILRQGKELTTKETELKTLEGTEIII